jgi:hypothetical protein
MRRWMVAVAVISLILWEESYRQRRAVERRRESYQRRASIFRIYARQFRDAYEKRSSNVFSDNHGPEFAATPALRLKWAQYYESLVGQYEHAASRPWEPVPPDPSPPEIVIHGDKY